DGLDRRDRGGDGGGRRALRRDRPERMPCHRRARLLARAHGGRLRGCLPRGRGGRPQRLSADPGHPRLGGFGPRGAGRKGPSFHRRGERFPMLALLLILLLLAVLFGGFFVFSLKVAIVVAIVLLLAAA